MMDEVINGMVPRIGVIEVSLFSAYAPLLRDPLANSNSTSTRMKWANKFQLIVGISDKFPDSSEDHLPATGQEKRRPRS